MLGPADASQARSRNLHGRTKAARRGVRQLAAAVGRCSLLHGGEVRLTIREQHAETANSPSPPPARSKLRPPHSGSKLPHSTVRLGHSPATLRSPSRGSLTLMQTHTLILTADDFGRSSLVNTAVERWHRAGAITQASLMVNEPAAVAAVEMARALPELRIGLHLTLCDGVGNDGTPLPSSPAWAGLRYAFVPSTQRWLQREIEAQFARFVELGLPPTYWDGHTHLHLHPVVMGITIPIARRYGFNFTRLVREPRPRGILPRIFGWLSQRAMSALREAGVGFADRVFGLRKSGCMDQAEVERALSAARQGTTEIYFHPGAEACIGENEVAEMVKRG